MGAQITSIEQLKEYAKGSLVELPAFSEGQPFVAMLKRPSMLAMVKRGTIPNGLLVKANTLFASGAGGFDEDDENSMKDMFDIMDTMCEASFVQPTYAEIKEAGIELTDEQTMFIFQYSQVGVKALEPFRKE